MGCWQHQKVLKIYVEKSEVKLENFLECPKSQHWMGIHVVEKGSWKKQEVEKSEVGKFLFKLESIERSSKVSSEVGRFRCIWKVSPNL